MKKQVIGEALGCLTQAWGLLQTGMPYSVLLLETYLFILLLVEVVLVMKSNPKIF